MKNRFDIYVLLNFLEKGLATLLPILISLKFLNSEYNDLEMIYIQGSFISIFIDIGVVKYMFYFNRDKKRSNIILPLLMILPLITISSIFLIFLDKNILMLSILRAVQIIIFQYISVATRLVDRINYYFLYSVVTNVAILALVLFRALNSVESVILAHYMLSLCAFTMFISKYIFSTSVKMVEIIYFIKNSIKYSLPIILASSIGMGLNWFVRKEMYGSYSTSDLYVVNLCFRIGMIVQLYNSSYINYVAKAIYSKLYDKKSIFKYILSVIVISVFSGCSTYVYCKIVGISVNSMFWNLVAINIYIVVWCLGSFSEVFLNAGNKNYQSLMSWLLGGFLFYILYFLTETSLILSLIFGSTLFLVNNLRALIFK